MTACPSLCYSVYKLGVIMLHGHGLAPCGLELEMLRQLFAVLAPCWAWLRGVL